MGNEFGAADLQPHLVYGLMQMAKHEHTGTVAVEVVGGGHHQKMRLRGGYILQVDAAEGGAGGTLTVYHGANGAATVVVPAGAAIGVATVITVVDQYKDAEPEDQITVNSDGVPTAGDSLFILMYELVE